jgi:predicted alpha-1,2-mannosidase
VRLFAALALVAVTLAPDVASSAQPDPSPDLAAYVNPFIGTAPAPNTGYGLEFDSGDTLPGAVYPSGMLAWSPDTLPTRLPGGYAYPDRTLKGFSLTHFSGRGCTVYQDVPILPTPGDAAGPNPTFQHANESAAPGDYVVTLDNGIGVELAATPRTGFGRFTFPSGSQPTIDVDAGGSVNRVDAAQIQVDAEHQLISGSLKSQVGCGSDDYTLYFVISFDQPFATNTISGSRASVTFATNVVQMKPAISYVSVENALANLSAEDAGWDLDSVRDTARQAWNGVLGRVTVEGAAPDELTVFYTALYHAFLEPNVFSDVDGRYIGFDDQVHQAPTGHAQYANIAGWDQYRSLIQLRTILAPDEASDILQSLVNDAQQGGGGMPRWEQANRNSAGMVGDSPDAFVASAYALGAREFDAQAALAALDLGASEPSATSGGHPVREFGDDWQRLGYVPEQPSITLEYATDDFALAQFARALGRDDLYARYMARSANWSNTFDAATGYVRSRARNGDWVSTDPAAACCGFVEGNGAQYTWMVAFDYSTLFARLGGNDAAVARLDQYFGQLNAGSEKSYAWMGNEPDLSAPWAYDFAGAPSRTSDTVARIRQTLFTPTPGGLPGNDDGGTLSAWYVFAALGVYPVIPGVGGFATASPMFASADVHLAGGVVLHITHDPTASPTPWVDWSSLSNGGTLVLP